MEERPREEADDHDLGVAEDRREPGPDVLDRVVPEDQVGGEERAREPGRAPNGDRSRPDPPVLPNREQPEGRESPEAAEERAGRGRDVGLPVEDPGEGDREGADEDTECRLVAEGVASATPTLEATRASPTGPSGCAPWNHDEPPLYVDEP